MLRVERVWYSNSQQVDLNDLQLLRSFDSSVRKHIFRLDELHTKALEYDLILGELPSIYQPSESVIKAILGTQLNIGVLGIYKAKDSKGVKFSLFEVNSEDFYKSHCGEVWITRVKDS